MVRVASARAALQSRTVATAVGTVALVLLLVSGLAFAGSLSVINLTGEARNLQWVTETITTSTLARAALVAAVAPVSPSDPGDALEQAATAQERLQRLFEAGETHDSYAPLARFTAAIDQTIGDLRIGDFAGAEAGLVADVEITYIDLMSALDLELDSIRAALDHDGQRSLTLDGWLVFVVVIVVPSLGFGIYRWFAGSRVRELEERYRFELEAERSRSTSKDAFIAGLSHHLRTPLTSIYGFAEILSGGEVRGAEAIQETARLIAGEAAEMARMVDDLMIASRLGSTGVQIELQPTSVQEVLDAAVAPFESVGTVIERGFTMLAVTADPMKLRHVLVNLISNAVRHGGPEVGVGVSDSNDAVGIEVWDTGPGIPGELIDDLFQRCSEEAATPLLTGRVGLGLAVAFRLTRLMGGRLEYQRYGGRTYFVITLPLARPTDEEESASVASMIRALSASSEATPGTG